MRYSKGAATLLSTVFTFRVKSGVVADDIFDSSSELLPGTDTANGLSATSTSRPTSANVDTGILNPDDAAANLMDISIAATCFNCVNGFVHDTDTNDPANRCFEKCNKNDCCTFDNAGTPEDACIGFTGKVCKDKSCNGKEACQNAKIPSVVTSCIGERACYKAGGDGGSIGNVDGSCDADFACYRLGLDIGKVGNVLRSCNTKSACFDAAADGGLIGSIIDSCKYGDFACSGLGFNMETLEICCTRAKEQVLANMEHILAGLLGALQYLVMKKKLVTALDNTEEQLGISMTHAPFRIHVWVVVLMADL